jgi:uncharacterized membrane protein (UPF0127 family)
LIAAIAIVAASSIVAAYTITSAPGSVASAVPSKFTIGGKTFAITYAATTPAQREQGLMNTKVTNTTIMLFVFPTRGYYQFWMYDTNASLDMIWVSASGNSGRVVYIVASAQPCYGQASCVIYTPTASANYVLEAKSGFVQANDIRVGATVQFS